MRRWLGWPWMWMATVVAVALAVLVIATGVHTACEAVEIGEAAHAAPHRPAIVSAAKHEPADPGAPWVVHVVVDRSPLRAMTLDCAAQAHEPTTPKPVPVDFTQTVITGGTTVATPSAGPVEYPGSGGAILPS